TACMLDADDDGLGDATPPAGVTPGSDCDDTNPDVPSTIACTEWCADADGDGYGDAADCVSSSTNPGGYVNNDLDCVDDHPGIFPGSAAREPELCTIDADGDGYGDEAAST